MHFILPTAETMHDWGVFRPHGDANISLYNSVFLMLINSAYTAYNFNAYNSEKAHSITSSAQDINLCSSLRLF